MTTVTHDEALRQAHDQMAYGGFSPWAKVCADAADYITQQRTREAEQQAEIARLRNCLMAARHYVADERLFCKDLDHRRRNETIQEYEDRISRAVQDNEDRQEVLDRIDEAVAALNEVKP